MNKDIIAGKYSWLDPWFTNEQNRNLPFTGKEKHLLEELTSRWEKKNRIGLLKHLSEKYGKDSVLTIIDAIVDSNARGGWTKTAEEQKTHSPEKFIEILWDPLPGMGFEFTKGNSGEALKFHVFKCPGAKLGQKKGWEEWLYHLICRQMSPLLKGSSGQYGSSGIKPLWRGINTAIIPISKINDSLKHYMSAYMTVCFIQIQVGNMGNILPNRHLSR